MFGVNQALTQEWEEASLPIPVATIKVLGTMTTSRKVYLNQEVTMFGKPKRCLLLKAGITSMIPAASSQEVGEMM